MSMELSMDGHNVRVKGFLFDKDGTLLNFVSLWGKWGEMLMFHVNKKIGEKVPAHQLLGSLPNILGLTCDEHGKVVDYDTEGLLSTGTIETIQEAIVQYSKSAGTNSSEAAMIAEESLSEAYKGIELLRPVQARAYIVDVLEYLREKGIRLAVVTADETEDAIKHLEWLGILDYFETIVGNDQVQRGKPNPDMVHLACERLGLSPFEVAVVGDTDSDMRMGKAAGAAFTVAIYPEGKAEMMAQKNPKPYSSADVVISSYEQLLAGLIQSTHLLA